MCSYGQITEEDELEMKADQVRVSCLNENVCLMTCQKYFIHDAWTAVPVYGTMGGATVL